MFHARQDSRFIEIESNLYNPDILKDDYFSIPDLSVFISVLLIILNHEISSVFTTLKSTSHFLSQFTVNQVRVQGPTLAAAINENYDHTLSRG